MVRSVRPSIVDVAASLAVTQDLVPATEMRRFQSGLLVPAAAGTQNKSTSYVLFTTCLGRLSSEIMDPVSS